MARKTNLIDYIDWRCDLPLDVVPFNEVDNLILSMVSYLDFSIVKNGALLSEAVDAFMELPEDERYLGLIMPDAITEMAVKVARCERFEGTRIYDFVNTVNHSRKQNEIQQFAAVTLLLPDESLFVAYRGTDDSLAGWKEDLLLGLTNGVPAQLSAAGYLKNAADMTKYDIRVGGHSKGGNLAVFASANVPKEIQDRILCVYTNDGPGFLSDFVQSDGYKRISEKIVNLIPESSIVGMLLEKVGEPRVIASSRKAVLQHDPFSWEVRVDRFKDRKGRTQFGEKSDAALRKWIESMDTEEKKEFAGSLFDVLDATGAKTLTDLRTNPIRCAAGAQKALNEMDKEKRDKFNAVLKRIFAVNQGK